MVIEHALRQLYRTFKAVDRRTIENPELQERSVVIAGILEREGLCDPHLTSSLESLQGMARLAPKDILFARAIHASFERAGLVPWWSSSHLSIPLAMRHPKGMAREDTNERERDFIRRVIGQLSGAQALQRKGKRVDNIVLDETTPLQVGPEDRSLIASGVDFLSGGAVQRGSFSIVTEGTDRFDQMCGNDDLRRAIKLLFFDGDTRPNIVRTQFLREVSHRSRLAPFGVVDVTRFDAGNESFLFLVNEIMFGSLHHLLIASKCDKKSIFEQPWFPHAVRFLVDVNLALDLSGVVHRDIKASNVLYRKEGDRYIFKIADFGFAALLASGQVANRSDSSFRGTLLYKAPEDTEMGGYSKGTDPYATGVTLARLCRQRPPATEAVEVHNAERAKQQLQESMLARKLPISPEQRADTERSFQQMLAAQRAPVPTDWAPELKAFSRPLWRFTAKLIGNPKRRLWSGQAIHSFFYRHVWPDLEGKFDLSAERAVR